MIGENEVHDNFESTSDISISKTSSEKLIEEQVIMPVEKLTKANAKLAIVKALEEEIIFHQHAYYNNQPEISDEEFDALWDRLRQLDVNNMLFAEVGKDSDTFFSKQSHIMPMGSLDKASDEAQLAQWVQQHKAEYYLIQHKLDGASLELQYRQGVLSAAVTRGNGKKGDNIIINARNMQGVLRKLPEKRTVAVRGEVIMTHDIHSKYFEDKANCRNAANGLMKRKDGKNVELLNFICYDIWFPEQNSTQHSEKEKLELLQNWGFCVVVHTQLYSLEEINNYRNSIMDIRQSIEYDIDGLVIKMPISARHDMESLRPDRQIAYKFPLEYAQTMVLDIEWSESGHMYTPVAILEPVQLAGTTVKRASLVHPNHIQELGVNIGAEVLVVKRGEIIPKIEKMVIPSTLSTVQLPEHCSSCGAKVENIGTRIFCPNLRCRRRLLFRVERWCELLEIDFWGETLLYKFVMKEKLINSLADLYKIDVQQLVSFERIGVPLAEKLLQSLHTKKVLSFEVFLAGLAIDGVALLTSEKIVQSGISDWATLSKMTVEELIAIDTIGPTLANNIQTAIAELQDEVKDLFNYVSITKDSAASSQGLKDLSFCFTGTLSMPRKEIQKLVKQNAGQVKSSVTKDLQYVVSNEKGSTSEKIRTATKQGISIISEEEFVALLRKNNIAI